LIVTILWFVVAAKTVQGAVNGSLFIAPDLVSLQEESRNEDVETGVVGVAA
jgi:hypothetical protein